MKIENFGHKVKGKYTPLTTSTGIEEIKKISILESRKPNYPYLFFESTSNIYVGLTIARQSSDLILLIAKKYINQLRKENKEVNIYLIQYMLPNDYSSNKLIVLSRLEPDTNIEKLKEFLSKIQEEFLLKLNQIAESFGAK